MNERMRRRYGRRMRHRSRSVAVSIGLWIAALPIVYLAVEAALELSGSPAIWQRPLAVLQTVSGTEALRLGVGAATALLGLVLLVLALAPGRLARHELADERMLVVVDDDVLAGAVSRAAAGAAGVQRDRVRTSVGRRRAEVRLRPGSGFPIDREEVDRAAERELDRLLVRPSVRTRSRVEAAEVVAR